MPRPRLARSAEVDKIGDIDDADGQRQHADDNAKNNKQVAVVVPAQRAQAVARVLGVQAQQQHARYAEHERDAGDDAVDNAVEHEW